jgi:hypothetical protein
MSLLKLPVALRKLPVALSQKSVRIMKLPVALRKLPLALTRKKKYQSALRNQKHMIITSVSKVALSAILPTDSSIRTVEDFVRASSLNCRDFPSYDDFCALGRDFLNHRFDTFLNETKSRVQKELHDIFERHSKLVSSRRPVAAGAAVASAAAAAAAAAVSALSATGGENVIFDLSSTAIRGDVEKPDFVAVPADCFERFHTADDKSVAWAGVSCVLELKQDTLPRSGDGYDNARGQLLQRMFVMTSDPSFGAIFSAGAALLLGWKSGTTQSGRGSCTCPLRNGSRTV